MIFDILLFTKNGARFVLTLPATDYILLDALEQLKPEPGEMPEWDFRCNYEFDFKYLTQYIKPNDNLYALNALTQRLEEMGKWQRIVFEGLVNIELEKGIPMTLERMADIASNALCPQISQAPALPLTPPEKPGYIFRILLNSREDGVHTELDLPAAHEELNAALDRLGVSGWNKVVFHVEDSAIPDFLSDSDFVTDGIEQINELAKTVRQLDSEGQLTKFKAVLKALEITEPGDAMYLAAYLDEYSLSPDLRSPGDVAADWLRTSLDSGTLEKLLPFINRHDYGLHILGERGEALTSYGLVTRCDGQPLHAQTIEPGGMEMS